MSHLRRIPFPERSPYEVLAEELSHMWRMLEVLSLRLALLERARIADQFEAPDDAAR